MEIDGVQSSGATAGGASATVSLGAGEFLQLLVTQLTNQDPLSPTSNEDLLAQLSSIREIELSTALTDSLKSLSSSQRYSSAAALIGKQVTSRGGDEAVTGTVVGVRFNADGGVLLELDSGAQVPLEQVATVSAPIASAKALVGRMVRGVDGSGGAEARPIEGVVTAVVRDSLGGALLELDTGEQLKFADVVSVAAVAA